MSAGQVCTDKTLHRQPPSLPFLCLSVEPVHLGLPTQPPLHLSAGFWRWQPTVSIVFFCGGEDGTLCLSTDAALGYLQNSFGEQTEGRGGGAGGQWTERRSLVHNASQNVNKQRRFLVFLKGNLLIEALTECQLRLHCLVWEMNEAGGAREGQKGERFRGVGAYTVSGAVCLLGSLLRQQVFDCVLDPNALIHPLGIIWTEQTQPFFFL